jgi:hypothetical protein
MDKRDVSIATMTWARDADEERLVGESAEHLAALGVPVYATDGGSAPEFVNFLRALPNFTVFEAGSPGVWTQARRSVRAAIEAGSPFVLYTESDKRDFFRDRLEEFVGEAPVGENLGVVLASRSAESYATFPEFQRRTEEAINRCCAELAGHYFDFTYGPFIFNRALLPALERLPDDIGWGWRPYAFAVAHRLGYRVESIAKDLPCPAEQREDDSRERLYRMRQLGQSVQGLLLSTA